MRVPKIIVVIATRVSVVVTIIFLAGRVSSIFNTKPKAMAPLIIPAKAMKLSYLKDTFFLCPNNTSK